MRLVYYVLFMGEEHLRLIRTGWKEEHCIVADGQWLIKMVAP